MRLLPIATVGAVLALAAPASAVYAPKLQITLDPTTARTPPAITRRLFTLITDYMRLPDTEKKLTGMGAEVDIKTGEEMRRIIPVEIAKWTKVAIAAGMPREQ